MPCGANDCTTWLTTTAPPGWREPGCSRDTRPPVEQYRFPLKIFRRPARVAMRNSASWPLLGAMLVSLASCQGPAFVIGECAGVQEA